MADHFVNGDFAVKLKHVPGEQNRIQPLHRAACITNIMKVIVKVPVTSYETHYESQRERTMVAEATAPNAPASDSLSLDASAVISPPLPDSPASGAPLVPQFFAGRSVFITGATGFLGKVLILRLLTTCPDVKRVFLLTRGKNDVTPKQRLQQLKNSEVFSSLRAQFPQRLSRLVVVPGDVSQPRLGVSDEDLQMLQEVSVVFHCAAQVKFNLPLKEVARDNILPAASLMELADSLQQLQILMHVSTAYCNSELEHIEELVYTHRLSFDQLQAAISLPDDILTDIQHKLIAPKPNTYTFSKALAESVVAEHQPRHYAVAIFRPAIVISSDRYPCAGWLDGSVGPAKFALTVGIGALHTFCMNCSARADFVPVDLCADTAICAAWDAATVRTKEARVYNCSSTESSTTWRQYNETLLKYSTQHPYNNAMWYPFLVITGNIYLYRVLELLLHRLPLYLLEAVYWMLGVKPKYSPSKISKNMREFHSAVEFFTRREWTFDVDNVRALRTRVSHADRKLFHWDVKDLSWEERYRNLVKGTRKYLSNEKDDTLIEAKRHIQRLRVLHYGVVLVSMVTVLTACCLIWFNYFIVATVNKFQ